MNKLKSLFKYTILYYIGGSIYCFIELLFRGYSHWSMFALGGICFILLGLINNVISWDMPLSIQMLIGTVIITTLEFITGCIVNLWLHLDVWDYSNMSFNLLGQICLPFSICWYFISLIGIVLDDYIRYFLFNEQKPSYKFF